MEDMKVAAASKLAANPVECMIEAIVQINRMSEWMNATRNPKKRKNPT